jgi:16S rRNA (adenine1518-N6/adenine1519-N6)-dimethyltransferase
MGARREAREALAAAGRHPRKRWGQHFLCDRAVADRIVETAEVGPDSIVLEIGPGLGALTDQLAVRAARLYLIEIDRELATRLESRYADNPRVEVLQGDALAVPLDEIVREPSATLVANLPYNISTPLLFRFLELRRRFPRAVLMLQKEVAARIVARAGSDDYGVTSVLVQAFAGVRLAFGVSRRSFLPPPRVDSAVVDIRWSAEPRADVADVELFRQVVRAAFGKRRKMLRNALAALLAERGTTAAEVFAAAGVEPSARAESLDLAAFAALSRAIARGKAS